MADEPVARSTKGGRYRKARRDASGRQHPGGRRAAPLGVSSAGCQVAGSINSVYTPYQFVLPWLMRDERIAAGPTRLFFYLLLLGAAAGGTGCTMLGMPGKSFEGTLPPLTEAEVALQTALRRDVEKLAGEIGERNVLRAPQLRAAAAHIEAEFAAAGWSVQRHSYEAQGEQCDNLEVTLPGSTHGKECIVVGAHYDSVAGSPGANDNASGVAALLALARLWRDRVHNEQSAVGDRPSIIPIQNPKSKIQNRTVRFVAFVNEEPPFFQTEKMGSLVYARLCQARGDQVVAMLALETIGFYSTAKGSQIYPFPVQWFYPSRGDFLGFVGNHASAKLVRGAIGSFRQHTSFPSQGATLPSVIQGVGWSDHWSFWQVGYPAMMLTDTAPFRYPYYHTAKDTPDKLDYERLARVVAGLDRVLVELASNSWQAGKS